MKTLQKFIGLIIIAAMLASCQTPKQVLSKSESRMEVMNNIASDHEMSKEMMNAIMSGGENGIFLYDVSRGGGALEKNA